MQSTVLFICVFAYAGVGCSSSEKTEDPSSAA
jgi:hypothetical protein